MEYPFPSKEKGTAFWTSPRTQMELLDDGARNPITEDAFGFSDLLNFESFSSWCNSPTTMDQMITSVGFSSCSSMPSQSFDSVNFTDQNSIPYSENNGAARTNGSPYRFEDRMASQQIDTQCHYLPGSAVAGHSSVKQSAVSQHQLNSSLMQNCMVSRPLSWSLDEKLLRALSIFKDSSGGGILIQAWVPIKHGDQYNLITSDQPYLLDSMLAGYRELSRAYAFSAEAKPGCFPGLPGRVFISKVPEWTSNVSYYNESEYLRVTHAADHKVRGSVAMPVFDSTGMSCCAVLELVTVKDKHNFDLEIESISRALQAVHLRTTAPPRLLPQCISRNQRAALTEIADILRAVCHAHRLPLALTWIPCHYLEGDVNDNVKVRVQERNGKSDGKCILCVEETACYVNDKGMEDFVHACAEHYLEEGQGVVGKALQSNHPFFADDVKTYHITAYPVVHHARKFGLNAAVAIRLRSTYTGDDDYILELFLPVKMKRSLEQQQLLNNLSSTMQKICKSLRTVSDSELTGDCSLVEKDAAKDCLLISMSGTISETALSTDSDLKSNERTALNLSYMKSDGKVADGSHTMATSFLKRPGESKRTTAEKNVSLSVLQQYFSGSLKDAAKSIGVCPTTLKRICRQHGISRWPSRKINKVNRSLKKIQTVLDSVQGVEGGLRFDPSTGGFVAAGSNILEVDSQKPFQLAENTLLNTNLNPLDCNTQKELANSSIDGAIYTVKLEESECPIGEKSGGQTQRMLISSTCRRDPLNTSITQLDCSQNSKSVPTDMVSGATCFGTPACHRNITLGSYSSDFAYNGSSTNAVNEMDVLMEGDNETHEHSLHNSSATTDSSSVPGSVLHGSPFSSASFEDEKHSDFKPSYAESGSKITVKATYKEDTIRFKFERSAGCFQLYEEVAKRFKLQNGTFQLKYLDDDEDWVMLLSDSDLEECLDILDSLGTQNVKFLVRDTPCTMGSSGGSNFMIP